MDVHEDQARDYPPRLYAEGASNLQNKEINHSCHMGDFPIVKEEIGHDVWDHLKEFSVGIIAKLVDRKFLWSSKTLHYLLCRQLQVYKKEIWSLVVDQPIRFSLHKFGEITGLNTYPLSTKIFELGQYKTPALEVCRRWIFEKHKWLGLLLLQTMKLYPLHHNSRILFEIAKRVFDDEAMMTYPWGQSAYEVLVNSIKILSPQGRSYTKSGLNDVLQVWAYESVSYFVEHFGRVVNEEEIPLFDVEIKDHGVVRVRKMAMKECVQELFPQWPDEADDPQLVNLITNIHAGRFVRSFWYPAEAPTKKQKKKKKKENAEGKVAIEEEGMGTIAALKSIIITLDNISRKVDNYDDKNIGDRVEVAVYECLKVLEVGENNVNPIPSLPSPHDLPQKSVNSPQPTVDKTPAKGSEAEKSLADHVAKANTKGPNIWTWLHGKPKQKEDEEAAATNKEVAELKKKQAEQKKQAAELKKQKTAPLRKQKAAELNKKKDGLKKKKADVKKGAHGTRMTRACVIRISITQKKQIEDDSELADVSDDYVAS
ncbi:hypothetical protein N665_0061s0002 [Sinapis alba]|nr:hypothetical protein N665_0061s0002 [Sinapis alba]